MRARILYVFGQLLGRAKSGRVPYQNFTPVTASGRSRSGGRAVALERKDTNKAIELLKDASAIKLGQANSALVIYLCPAYVRGEAYLTLGDGKAAAAEFQKFIEHRGVVVNFPWGALARLQLARAYAMQGDTAKAKAAYLDFLALWKAPILSFQSSSLRKQSTPSCSSVVNCKTRRELFPFRRKPEIVAKLSPLSAA